MELKHHNITIRNAVPENALLLAAWWNDGAVMAHAGFPNGLGTTADKVAQELAQDSDNTRRRLILLFGQVPIGEMVYRNLGNQAAEIGIKICKQQYQEKGIGRVALSMLIKHLFRTGYTRILLDTDLNNTRAQHVYEMLGFQKLRVNRNSWQNQLGVWESSVDYELMMKTFHDFAV